jgi:hypothetical protein
MEQPQIDQFLNTGQSALTILAQADEQLRRWSASFEQRGGAPVFGNDALEIVYISNDLKEFLTPERMATIARLRTDV